MGHEYILKRNSRFYYRRRVPEEISHLDRRSEIKISLKTEDEKEAQRKAMVYNEHIESFWRALAASGNAVGIKEKYAAAIKLAKTHGYTYKSALDVSCLGLSEVVERIELSNDSESAVALLGGAEKPKITLYTCREEYFAQAADKAVGKSERWRHKWKTDRTRAINGMIEVLGNLELSQIRRAHILEYRQWWLEQIQQGKNPDTANKQFRYCKEMLREAALAYEIDLNIKALFEETRFSVTEKSRPPFEPEFVTNTLLAGLSGMRPEARAIVYILAETGTRPSEIYRAKADAIKLEEKIPYIHIRGDLKTKTSERRIPLVGYALKEFAKYPQGFSWRWKNENSMTAGINKYMRENNLLPSSEHSLYSLRHTFKDRLRDIGAPEEIIDELMGHKKDGPKYGRGHTLEMKKKWLQKIAFGK